MKIQSQEPKNSKLHPRHILKCLIEDRDGKILLVRRSATAPRRPLEWDFPGGFADKPNDLTSEIIREVSEETGLNIVEPKLVYALTKSFPNNEFDSQSVIFLFYHCLMDRTNIKLSYEHDKALWAKPSEILVHNHYDIHQQAARFIFNL